MSQTELINDNGILCLLGGGAEEYFYMDDVPQNLEVRA